MEFGDIKKYEKRFCDFLKDQIFCLQLLKDNKARTPKKGKFSIPVKQMLRSKEQIMLLNEIGFFELDFVKNLTTESKGRLFSKLLNRNWKNITEYIRYCDPDGHKSMEDNPYRHSTYLAKIQKFIEELKSDNNKTKL